MFNLMVLPNRYVHKPIHYDEIIVNHGSRELRIIRVIRKDRKN